MKLLNTQIIIPAWVLLVVSILTPGCDDGLDATLPASNVTINLEFPAEVDPSDVSNEEFMFLNVSNGISTSFRRGETLNLIPGLYDISYSATVELPNAASATLKALRQSVVLTKGDNNLILSPYINITADDLIISEIFFTGTLQRSGNQYYGDDYIKLYNNTDKVIYADGLTIFESMFTTTEKNNYTPDIMGEAMTVDALYTIPGSGTDHPVNPGEYLLIADTGVDHRVMNPNSFDLSGADWEWYDVSTVPSSLDIDSPSVENLDKWYCYTQSFWMLHNRGFKAYGVARIPVDKQIYLKDYFYSFDYEIVTQAGTFPMSRQAYRLPNDWIVDVVNCSVASDYQWNVCTPRLDMGWTYCGSFDKDKSRFFHAVRRKMIGLTPSGKPILQDTNNSTVDFNPMVTPSEIEIQGTAKDAYGTPCTVRTYDGVTPMPVDSMPVDMLQ
ncbi:MAG: DUF4876 domain-containing protein [Muribaculaceae bacterium]|nr:DUF4876 domain-containing protein [Muribaculaceae bacterium]